MDEKDCYNCKDQLGSPHENMKEDFLIKGVPFVKCNHIIKKIILDNKILELQNELIELQLIRAKSRIIEEGFLKNEHINTM